MNNLLSYCGLVNARVRASKKDLPVEQKCFCSFYIMYFFFINFFFKIGSGDNVRVGGGGTLLRSAVRQSLRRNTSQNNNSRSAKLSSESPDSSTNDLSLKSQVHTVQVHHQLTSGQHQLTSGQHQLTSCQQLTSSLQLTANNVQEVFSQQVEEELNCLAEETEEPEIDMPPPPRYVN